MIGMNKLPKGFKQEYEFYFYDFLPEEFVLYTKLLEPPNGFFLYHFYQLRPKTRVIKPENIEPRKGLFFLVQSDHDWKKGLKQRENPIYWIRQLTIYSSPKSLIDHVFMNQIYVLREDVR